MAQLASNSVRGSNDSSLPVSSTAIPTRILGGSSQRAGTAGVETSVHGSDGVPVPQRNPTTIRRPKVPGAPSVAHLIRIGNVNIRNMVSRRPGGGPSSE
jgi:hypothetical protein